MKKLIFLFVLCLIMVASVVVVNADTYDPSLLGFWSLEGNAYDQTAYRNNGQIVGSVPFATGVVGQTAKFAAYGNYIEIPSYSNFNNLTSFTLAAWIYPTSYTDYASIISKVDPNRDFVLWLINGKLNVHFAINSAEYYHCTSTTQVPLNQWTYVAAVWTGSMWQLYSNGVLISQASTGGRAPQWTGTRMGIGMMDGDYPFQGKIDEVRVYNRGLSGAEISALYNSPLPKGIWCFEGNAIDQTGYANGTLVNGASYSSGIIGQGVNLSGSAHVDIANYTRFNNMGTFTLSAWINPSRFNSANPIISKVTPNRDFVFQVTSAGNLNVHFAINSSQYYHCTAATTLIPLNTWTYVTAVWTGSGWKLYQNGVLVSQATFSGVAPSWTGTIMEIGAMTNAYFFTGKIDEAKVFSGALSDTQVNAEYLNGISGHNP